MIEPYIEELLLSSLGRAEASDVSEEPEFAQAQAALEAAEATLAAHVEALGAEGVSAQTFATVVAKLEQERDDALERVAELSVRPTFSGPLGERYGDLSLPEKRQLLSQVFSRVIVKPGRGLVERVEIALAPRILELAQARER